MMVDNTRRRFGLLLVDDEPNIISALKRLFHNAPYDLHCAGSGAAALEVLQQTPVDLALIDLKMPGMDGMTLLKEICSNWPSVRVLILTGHGGVQEAVAAIKMGAVDFLQKPFENEALAARIKQQHELWVLEQENHRLREQVEFNFTFDQLVGHSSAILSLKKMILQIAGADASVLIQGETGTGKELVARAVHHHSPRAKQPFVPVDCAALNETVLGSELFGHVKGAFTGAHESTAGLIRSAHRGTLFLDEVGELPLTMQVKLLRTIQEKEVRPVGASHSQPVDVHILAATNRDLGTEVTQGRFRQDLYYRLNVVVLQAPPLRERIEDIPLLAQHFLSQLSTALGNGSALSKEALAFLTAYEWPGNVRELENVIRRAVAIGQDQSIQPSHLPDNIFPADLIPRSGEQKINGDTLEAYELEAIRKALTKCQGHRKNASRMLGIGEATLYRKIAKYQLEA